MDVDHWNQIKAVFQEALERTPDERAAFLDQACAGNPMLRQEVASLLDAEEKSTSFLEEGEFVHEILLPDAVAGARRIGDRIGPYRLLQIIGYGGMGTVYRAERVDGTFDQEVAIKLVRPGMLTEDLVRRFRAERQILASLQHPNIAHLFDGGVMEDGLPYLAMEYIDGRPIDVHCDAERLSTEARLQLFLDVCEAVQYAHQKLIVHRDLKPSNVLVTKDGRVKLLDFGIAKLLDENRTDATPLTRTYMRVLTPEYASPAQLRGEPVTTASDIYSLGVILYELLAGHRPFAVRGLTPGEIERLICEEEPSRPSTAITRPLATTDDEGRTRAITPDEVSQLRATQPEKLRRRLAGDLDNIVLMALRKDPERRYKSAEQLAEDIRRHLNGLPVMAHPESIRYRTFKFIRRHRVGMAATSLVFLLLVGGIVTTAHQAQRADRERLRAEQRFADVRQLANAFLFDLHDDIATLPGSTPVRERLVTRSLEYLDKLAQEAGNDPSLQLELAMAYRKVGDVQGNPTNANLGQTQRALESYRKGVRIVQDVLDAQPAHPEAHRTLGLILERLADVQGAMGRFDAADSSLHTAVDLYRMLAEEAPNDPGVQRQYAIGLIKLGDLLGNPNFPNKEQPDAALERYLAAKPILERIYTTDSSQTQTYRLLGLIYERIGTIHDAIGDHHAARAAFRQSMEIRAAYAKAHPTYLEAMRDLAIAHEKMGDVAVKLHKLQEAQQSYTQATDIFRDLWQRDAKNVQAQQSLAISYLHLGDLAGYPDQPNLGDPHGARRHYQEAQHLLQDLRRVDSTNARTVFLLDYTRKRIARVGG